MTAIRNGRKVCMSAQDCFEFSQSSEGSARLVNPTTFKTSSRDPHRGLYPRIRTKSCGKYEKKCTAGRRWLQGTQLTGGPSVAGSTVGDIDCRLQDFLDDDVMEGSGMSDNVSVSDGQPPPRSSSNDVPLAGFQSAKSLMADSLCNNAGNQNSGSAVNAGKTKRLPKYVLEQKSNLEGVWLKRRLESVEACGSGASATGVSQNERVQPKGQADFSTSKSTNFSARLTFSKADLLQSPSKAIVISDSNESSSSASTTPVKREAPSPSYSVGSLLSPRKRFKADDNATFATTQNQGRNNSNVSSSSASTMPVKQDAPSPSSAWGMLSPRKRFKADNDATFVSTQNRLRSNSNKSSSSGSTTPVKQEAPSPSSVGSLLSPTKRFKADEDTTSAPTQNRRRNKKAIQRNTLLNYFEASPKRITIVPSDTDSLSSPQARREISGSDSSDDVVCLGMVRTTLNSKQHAGISSLGQSAASCSNATSLSSAQSGNELPEEFKDLYGLLGKMEDDPWDVSDEETTKPNPFLAFPNEILEHIFSSIAMKDLGMMRLVCRQWNDVISREKFSLWKKTYYRLKKGDQATFDHITGLCNTHDMFGDLALKNLIRFMKNFKAHVPNITACLRWHSKYSWALAFLQERLPECVVEEEPNCWCLVTALCILSLTVNDMLAIQACLTHTKSLCGIQELMECLYCIATFFFHFKKEYHLYAGYHYRLYYALYLFENKGTTTVAELNAFSVKSTGQQCIRKYGNRNANTRLTLEQLRIVNHQLEPNQLIKIVAFAGTGKTTTLIEFTKLWPSKRFLNISYNKSVSDHGKKIFPTNVTCRTMHSLAWGGVGKRFRGKLKYKVTPFDVLEVLAGTDLTVRAGRALKAINSFVNTADPFITTAHVPARPMRTSDDHNVPTSYTDQERLQIADDAETIWKGMTNPGDYKTKITHDVYLKLYQLSHPVVTDCDCLLVDEAQDCNGAMLDIIMSQRCPKIVVGDPHQQIYAFRGAVDALASINATHIYYLTQSFRFGPEISFVASCALEVMKREHRNTIVGGTHSGGVDGQAKGQVAIIARTNVNLFLAAARLCGERRIHGAFVGGIKSYDLNRTSDIYKLMQVGIEGATKESLGIKDNFIKRFSSFAKLLSYAKKVEDVELLGKIKLAQMFGSELPNIIRKITEQCSYPLESATYVFSTAHKSKGHEFDTVQLTDDYVCRQFKVQNESLIYETNDEEANILYVAITRAKKHLVMSPEVMLLLLMAGEKFEHPYLTESLRQEPWFEDGQWECVSCRKIRIQNVGKVLTAVRKKITLTKGPLASGPLCYICASNPYINLNEYNVATAVMSFAHFANIEGRLKDPAGGNMRHLVGPIGPDEAKEADDVYSEPRENAFLPFVQFVPFIEFDDL